MKESDIALVHIADLHVGGFRFAYNYISRTETCCNSLSKSILSIKAKRIIVTLTGDLLDGKNMREHERNIALRFVASLLQDKRITLIMINGNHEYYDHLGMTMLNSFGILNKYGLAENLRVVTHNPGVVVLNFDNLSYRFLCVPCQQNLTSKELRGIVRGLIKSSSGKYTRTYAVIHEAFGGALGDNGRPIEANIDALKLDFAVDGYLLGDIHKRQQLSKNAWYCGSPWQTKYIEDTDKGYLIWRGSDVEFIGIDVPKLIETDSVKKALRYADTEHSVRYTGLEILDREYVNITHVPKVKNQVVEMSDHDIDTEDVTSIRALSTNDVVGGLKGFLGAKAKLPKHEVKLGLRRVREYMRDLGVDS